MAIKVITTRLQIDTTDLEKTLKLTKELADELNVSEEEAGELTEEFTKQVKAVDKLTKEEKELVKVQKKATDPKAIRKFNRELKKTQKEIKKISGGFKKAGDQGKKSMGIMGKAAQALGPIIAAAFSINLIKDFIVSTVEAASRFEQTMTAFTTLLGGSSEAAEKLIGDLERLSLSTPLTPESLNQAAKTLLAFGIAQDKILPTLQQLGDVAQGDSQTLQQLALVFGQISATGKLMGQDLNQLINVGFNPLQTIAKKTGRSMADLKKDMEKGLITFDRVEQAFKDATSEGGLFFGAMDAQSKTFSGRVSTLEGNVDKLKQQLGDQLLPIAGEFVELLLAMTQNAEAAGEKFKGVTAILDGLLVVLEFVTDAEEENAAVTTAMAMAIENMIHPLLGLIATLKGANDDLERLIALTDELTAAANSFLGIDLATPFKDAADAMRKLELRQKASAAQTEFLTDAMDRFKAVTSATDEEVAAFRKQFRGFDTDGLTVEQAIKRLGFEFGAFLATIRKGKKEIGDTGKEIEELGKESMTTILVLNELFDGDFGFINAAALYRKSFADANKSLIDGTANALKQTTKLFGRRQVFLDRQRADGLISQSDFERQSIDLTTDALEFELRARQAAGEETIEIEKELAQRRIEIRNEEEDQRKRFEEALINAAIDTASRLVAIQGTIRENRIEQSITDLDAQKEREIEAAGGSAAAREAIEIRFNKVIEEEEQRLARVKQQNAIGQAIIDGALAATKTIATFGFPAAIPFLALSAALVAGEIALIKSQKFAKGIIDLDGPGSGTSDSIPAMLSKGESVMTAKQTQAYMPTLKAMRAGFSPDLLNHIALNGFTNRMIGTISSPVMGDKDILKMLGKQNKNLERIAKKDMKAGDVFINLGLGPSYSNRKRKWN